MKIRAAIMAISFFFFSGNSAVAEELTVKIGQHPAWTIEGSATIYAIEKLGLNAEIVPIRTHEVLPAMDGDEIDMSYYPSFALKRAAEELAASGKLDDSSVCRTPRWVYAYSNAPSLYIVGSVPTAEDVTGKIAAGKVGSTMTDMMEYLKETRMPNAGTVEYIGDSSSRQAQLLTNKEFQLTPLFHPGGGIVSNLVNTSDPNDRMYVVFGQDDLPRITTIALVVDCRFLHVHPKLVKKTVSKLVAAAQYLVAPENETEVLRFIKNQMDLDALVKKARTPNQYGAYVLRDGVTADSLAMDIYEQMKRILLTTADVDYELVSATMAMMTRGMENPIDTRDEIDEVLVTPEELDTLIAK